MKINLFFPYLIYLYLLINSIILLLLDLNGILLQYIYILNGSFVDFDCIHCPHMQVALDKSVC